MESIEQVAVGFARDWRPSSLKSRASTRATSSREPCGCKKRVTTGRSLVISPPQLHFSRERKAPFREAQALAYFRPASSPFLDAKTVLVSAYAREGGGNQREIIIIASFSIFDRNFFRIIPCLGVEILFQKDIKKYS